MSYNTPVRILQNGSVIEVGAGGTLNVLAGGSIQNAGGQSATNLAVTTLTVTNPITLGGTTAKWAFGTAGITSGVGTIGVPGFTRVLSANANPILGETQAAGSAAFVFVDLSLSGAGSVIYRLGSVGGALWNANGTLSWMAYGT